MRNDEKIKLTVIIRLQRGGNRSRDAVASAAAEAAAAGAPFELVLWDAKESGGYGALADGIRGSAPYDVAFHEGAFAVSAVNGEYFCVLDDDDYWEKGAVPTLIDYLDAHAADTDVAFAHKRMAKAKRRPLAYRRIANMPPEVVLTDEQFERINTMYKGAMIRTDAVRKALPTLSDGDGELLCMVAAVVRRMRYAVVHAAVIRYTEIRGYRRDKADEDTVRDLFALSRRLCGGLPLYVQSVALECLYFSLKRKETDLTALSLIGAEVIERAGINRRAKEYLFRKKYGEDVMRRAQVKSDGVVLLDGVRIGDISRGEGIKVSVLDVRGGRLFIDGLVFSSVISSGRLIVTDGKGGESECEILPHPPEDVETAWGEKIALGERYRVDIKLARGRSYRFVFDDGKGVRVGLKPFMGSHSRLNDEAKHSYFVKGGYRLSFSKAALRVRTSTRRGDLKAEVKYLAEIAREKEFGVVLYRLMYRAARAFKRKPIWLVGDRPQFAKDNAEHLFRYFAESGMGRKRDIYFVLDKASDDYERMRKYGRTLPFDTVGHRVKFLLSDKVILSTANDVGTNPFSSKRRYYQDLYSFDYVFLRHGVSHNDMSGWINKLNKNIRLLVSSTPREYEAILHGNYCYDESVVKLTGLPRYDNLTSDPKKLLIILPTWRKNLQGKILPASPKREYRSDFKTSDYFLFYHRLMNDERLLAAMRRGGYRGKFFLHPVFDSQIGDFEGNGLFEVGVTVADYQELFRDGDLLLTDYSSVAFDFAYLKKPVIYAQFDFDTFYQNHSWGKSYFSYADDGFGPIGRDYEETVALLVRYIEGGCVMTDEYKARVDGFFAFTDRRNCERVAAAIEEMDGAGVGVSAGAGAGGAGVDVGAGVSGEGAEGRGGPADASVVTNTARIAGGRLVLDVTASPGFEYAGFVIAYRHKIEEDRLERVFPAQVSASPGGGVRLRARIPLSDIPFRMTNWSVSVRAQAAGAAADIPVPFKKPRGFGRLSDFLSGGGASLGGNIVFTYPRGRALGLRYRAKGPYDGVGFRLRELAALVIVKLLRGKLKKDRAIIIYERDHAKAQDNAWYLFKYCMENDVEGATGRSICYAIDRNAPDYGKMRRWKDHVLDFPSLKFLVRALSASLLVSTESRMHDYFRYPARSVVAPRLAKKKSVFLQHGVLAFKRLNAGFDERNLRAALVTCIAEDEARIMREWHGFPDDRIAITGYARFDALEDRSGGRREILMMPTHRSWLFGVEEDVFVSSEYYVRYAGLLRSPGLAAVLEAYDLTLNFIVHPSIAEHSRLFAAEGAASGVAAGVGTDEAAKPGAGRIRLVAPGEEAIDDLMMRAKVLITDYSSIAWDMYYMDKPSLFYQFDTERYDEAWGSYIDLEKDMPGPRAATEEELIALLERCAADGFVIGPRYEGMRQRYFKYLDRNNCRRIVEAITQRGL
jgi:CDP-glycerol glycerophosphotransferase (TagB/SpsB family)